MQLQKNPSILFCVALIDNHAESKIKVKFDFDKNTWDVMSELIQDWFSELSLWSWIKKPVIHDLSKWICIAIILVIQLSGNCILCIKCSITLKTAIFGGGNGILWVGNDKKDKFLKLL